MSALDPAGRGARAATAAGSAATATPGAVGPALAAVALALLLGLQPVATDVYLPALPMLARALAAPMAQVQLTMSALVLAFGIAQMAWGPLADRVGRRPVLLAGLVLYTAAGVGCALAQTIEALVAWRILQGVAMAAAVVCARAIVRDLYAPVEGARVMTLALSGLGVIALVGPALGGLAAQFVGWRGPLALMAAVGAATLVFIAARLPETLALKNLQATQLRALLPTWLAIARDPVFRAWTLLVACTYGGLFTMLAASSFVFIDILGATPVAYGAAMALGSLSYIGGTFACRRSIARRGLAGTVRRGAWWTLAAGASIALATALGVQAWWAVLLPYCLFVYGHGHHQPCGQAGVVAPFPRNAGAASALAGLVLALVAFGIGRWLGGALDGTVRPLAYGLAFWACATCAVAWTLVQRHATPAR